MNEYNPSLDSVIAAFRRVEKTKYDAEVAEYALERMITVHKNKFETAEFFRISEEIRAEWDVKRAELSAKRSRFLERWGLPPNAPGRV